LGAWREIAVPDFNEESVLKRASLSSRIVELEMLATWQKTIADNASTDKTPSIAVRLAELYA
jgi:hypothetical protein